MKPTRRDVLGAASALSAGALLAPHGAFAQGISWAERARSAGERELVMAGGTGAYAELVKTHFIDPFTAATGIRVTNAGGTYGEKLARLRAMTQVGRVEWDIVTLSVDALMPATTAMLRDLGGCGDLPTVTSHGVPGACLGHAVMFDIGGGVLAFSKEAFPEGRPQPASWADFWDVARFPGARALPNIGTPWWPIAAALLADGVSPETLFPLDVDRALRKLDQIKPHVTVWWRSGDQSQQIFRNKEVVMGQLFAGRAGRLGAEGLPIGIVWNGAPLDASCWAVTRAAPRPNAAMALLEFVYTRPQAHAEFAVASFGSTAHKEALALLPEAARSVQAVAPQNWSRIVRPDPAWLAANQERLTQRWAAWLAG